MPRVGGLPVALLDVTADVEAAEKQCDPDDEIVAHEVHAEEPIGTPKYAAGDAIDGYPSRSAPHREQDHEGRDRRLPEPWEIKRLPDQRNNWRRLIPP